MSLVVDVRRCCPCLRALCVRLWVRLCNHVCVCVCPGPLTGSTGFLRDGKVPVKAVQIVGVALVVLSTVLFGKAKAVSRRNAVASRGPQGAAPPAAFLTTLPGPEASGSVAVAPEDSGARAVGGCAFVGC